MNARDDDWDQDYDAVEASRGRKVSLVHRVEDAAAGLIFGLLRLQSVEGASRRMGRLLVMLGPLLRPVHARGHANLQLIYPDMTRAERSAILRGAWRNLGNNVGEYPHMKKMAERTVFTNPEVLTPFTEGKKPAIFVLGHYANWEVAGVAASELGLRFGVIYRPLNNPLIDRRILRLRAAAMTRVQIPKDKRGGRALLRAVKDDISLCVVADQKLNDGQEIPLLGYPAMTATAAARLALKEDVPLIPVETVRRPDARFEVTFHTSLTIRKSGDMKDDTVALATRMNEALGRLILRRPDQWLWFHRRWPKHLS